ncbi:MAG: hypothetical protein AAGF66_16145, partial [Cyanobacteria bacterium P01_H01_bin.119]
AVIPTAAIPNSTPRRYFLRATARRTAMILLSFSLNAATYSPEETQALAWRAVKAFWRFSRFYGQYQSLPPTQRQGFVNQHVGSSRTSASR